MAGKKTLGELSIILGMDTQVFEKKMQSSKSELNGFKDQAKDFATKFTAAFAGLAAVGVTFAGIKSAIESVEGPGDKFNATIAGGKESLFELQRAVATLDFSNLLDNLKEGFNRGKELEEALDALADRNAYNDYVVVGLQQEAEALRETTKNKQLDIKVRSDAATKLEEIEGKILARRKKIINDTYNLEKLSWEGRQKISTEQGVKLFESMAALENEGYNKVKAETVKKIKEVFDASIANGNSIEDAAKLVKFNLAGMGNYDFIKDIPKDDLEYIVNTFEQFTNLSTNGEKDVWVKLFAGINTKTMALADAQRDYNSALGETSKIRSQDDKATEKKKWGHVFNEDNTELEAWMTPWINTAWGESWKKAGKDIPIEEISPLDKLAGAIDTALDPAAQKFFDFVKDMNQTAKNFSADLVATIAGGFGEALVTGDWDNFGANILDGFGKFAQQFGALLIAYGMADFALKFSPEPFSKIAAGVALVALGSALSAAAASSKSVGSSSAGSYSGASVSPYSSSNNTNRVIQLEWKRAGKDLVAIIKDENTSFNALTGKR